MNTNFKMNMKAILLENTFGSQASSAEGITRAQNLHEKKGEPFPVFKDILGGAMQSKKAGMGNGLEAARPQTKPEITAQEAAAKSQPRTFRDVERSVRNGTVKVSTGSTRAAASAEDEGQQTEAEEPKAVKAVDGTEQMLSGFAQVLGLKPQEFKLLLEVAGISPEELTSLTQVGKLADKMAGVFGLNAEQKTALADLLKIAGEEMTAMLKQTGNETASRELAQIPAEAVSANKQNTACQGIQVTVEKLSAVDGPAEFAALMTKLKAKLEELGLRLKSDRSAMMEEIRKQINALMADSDETVKEAVPSAKLPETPENLLSGEKPVENQEAGLAKGADKQEAVKAVEESSKESVKEARTVEADAPVANSEPVQQPFVAVNPASKADPAIQVEKASDKAPVAQKEILHQVIEKAKVILTGDKSEMVMDLKPESLGKLSLKVVTEHGIVQAKFVAENQQVKQVLEANMQILKDSLEKQGLSVQGFSVSVGQQGNEGFSRRNEFAGERPTAPIRAGYGANTVQGAVIETDRLQRNNPYLMNNSSTINLTA